MAKTAKNLFIFLTLIITSAIFPQAVNLDTVKMQQFDMGKMWTFDNPPLDYFEKEYGFRPTEEWLEHVRQSALRFGNGCSASFVSEDGLIMSNHHCIRGQLPGLNIDNENILKEGFYASTLEEERIIPDLFVDQLIIIRDITDRIHAEMEKGKTDEEKLELKNNIITLIENEAKEYNNNLVYRIIPFYNGGRYSLYGYKRYNDVRLVFVPDLPTAKLGGDPDNFTYPRYGLDCAFFRAYENGEPVKTNFYFKWCNDGAKENEVVFVVGNPGSTDRINTISQILYSRDIQYPLIVSVFEKLYKVREKIVLDKNAEDFSDIARLYSVGNTLKVFKGTYKGLLDEVLIARKKDFEKQFRKAVNDNLILKEKYAHVWDEIEATRKEAATFAKEMFALTISNAYSPAFFRIGRDVVKLARELQKPEEERNEKYRGDELQKTKQTIFPSNFNIELEKELLKIQLSVWEENLEPEHYLLNNIISGKKIGDAVEYLLSRTSFTEKESFLNFLNESPDKILNSNDPFIKYTLYAEKPFEELQARMKEINNKEAINKQLLGNALFEVYGTSIPPDATFSLRIADGIVKGYEYNGTVAPIVTTFYGVLDRHFSHGKKFPFNLHERWNNLPKEFDLSKPLNFISTNDIIGGNSGSPVINIKGEIVGLAFDGNIESLPNRFIYTTEANRTVSVHSAGMIEAIGNLYKAHKLRDELIYGKRN